MDAEKQAEEQLQRDREEFLRALKREICQVYAIPPDQFVETNAQKGARETR